VKDQVTGGEQGLPPGAQLLGLGDDVDDLVGGEADGVGHPFHPPEQHPTEAAVAIAVGVDGLELGMDHRSEGDGVELGGVGDPDEVTHKPGHVLGRRGHVGGLAG